MNSPFPHLFSPLKIRGLEIRNRIFTTGHDTNMAENGLVGDTYVAYQEARAAGGAGLIIVQVSGVHETARYTAHLLMATEDDCIPGYRRLSQACHRHGTKVFFQLFHPGREIMESQDGTLPVAYAPSVSPADRFHVIPRELSVTVIEEIVDGFRDAARRVAEAGGDGVEIVASHGYLPAQFLSRRINRRDDEYGGSEENRLRFLRDVITAARQGAGPDLVVGMRISGDEKDPEGLTQSEALAACEALQGELDYVNVIAGTSGTQGGAVHIVPPMMIEPGYVAPEAESIKGRLSIPVFVAGRINQPQIAEQILSEGQADMCGMTRALISDPELPAKAAAGRLDDIRACIGCNQACIGHMQLGHSISCIQRPETGRELIYGARRPAPARRRVLVAGGGPGGLKAAAVAAERGHEVSLYEAGPQLGGQVLLAQLLPERAEFGGLVTNLAREAELAGVDVRLNTAVTPELVREAAPDVVILATGARPRRPEIEGQAEAHIVDAWQVLRGEANPGSRVVIADWRADWVGLGLAQKLALDGCGVRLLVNGRMAGQTIQNYTRDHWIGTLHRLGVEIVTEARLYGADADSVYAQHTVSGAPMVFEDTDTLVLALGHEPESDLAEALADWAGELHLIGDCLAPRTAEEAVLDGLRVASEI
ncbi:MAG: FAD-dependent oxidoreductase [Alphaproteobacteria bacterium]|nr:FAD-dependent oxidoreductase [Alphaproteobacteria bacterium]